MLKVALKIGLKHSDFWELTLFEFQLSVEDYKEKKQEEIERDLTNNYFIGYYCRHAFGGKHYPKLADELAKIKVKKQEQMTDEAMLNQVKVLNIIYGGEVNT